MKSLEAVQPKPGEKPEEALPFRRTHNIRGQFKYKGGDDNNYYIIDNVNATLTFLQSTTEERSLNIKEIKLIAQTALGERTKYDNFVNFNMVRDYRLTINDENDIVWNSAKQRIIVFCKWDVEERI
ncbi:MAG: hypothetical protein MRERV_33c017 [Mycoplasmataceae bacterium RV_VA103A]|nr:MAG: hypothetical protein MRERV_33c017 [Mycoplasmataceae bacterium RV_VA103A]